jgi:hypothetical protein
MLDSASPIPTTIEVRVRALEQALKLADWSISDLQDKAATAAAAALLTGPNGWGGGGGSISSALWFTTSAITAATQAGTTVSTAVLTYGSGTARHCIPGATGTMIPDTGASDITIYSALNGSSIPIDQFVKADLNDDGKWVIDIAWC